VLVELDKHRLSLSVQLRGFERVMSEEMPNDDQVGQLSETIDALIEQGIDLSISFLEVTLMAELGKKHVLNAGSKAIPRLQLYLAKQAEKERNLTNDLSNYFSEKETLNREYQDILHLPTDPMYRGSNEISDALEDCDKRIRNKRFGFFERWRFDPESKDGVSRSIEVPNLTGVMGAVDCLIELAGSGAEEILKRLREQAKLVAELNLPKGYCSVFRYV
jgi:hypothetical protein